MFVPAQEHQQEPSKIENLKATNMDGRIEISQELNLKAK